ncbi:MAG: hypothetical protein II161_05610 [Erysipelotrichaceae bacterium]|nr:hypothetical protein [Erysipelotrichaceae bacterium]
MMNIIKAVIQCTWGCLQTLVGLAVFLFNIKDRHYIYKGEIVTNWHARGSVSLGLFLFIGDYSERLYPKVLLHEYGHSIQSLLLGPLYLPIIGLPSFIWCNLPALRDKRRRERRSYYSFYTEAWANDLARKRVDREFEIQD